MSNMEMERSFMQMQDAVDVATEKLKCETDSVPDSPAKYSYRPWLLKVSDLGYTLEENEELRLADNLAFLLSTERGSRGVTAVAIEECHDGTRRRLKVCVAAHDGRQGKPAALARTYLNLISGYATALVQGRLVERKLVLGDLLSLVGHFNKDRIWQRIEKCRRGVRVGSEFPEFLRVKGMQREPHSTPRPREAKRRLGGARITEKGNNLRHVLVQAREYMYRVQKHCPDGRMMVLVGNLARYITASESILQLVELSPHLFENVKVIACAKINSKGSVRTKVGNVHAEMRIVAHYELNSVERPPRAIGCSKLACYLCHCFLRNYEKYWIVGAHNRAYLPWTLPSFEGIGEESWRNLTAVMEGMLRDMERDMERDMGRCCNLPYPIESVAPSQMA